MIPFQHQPVLLQETIDMLALKPGMKIIDCTVGGGGHSTAILKRILPGGYLVGIDQDGEALVAADEQIRASLRLRAENETQSDEINKQDKPYQLVHRNFSQIKEICTETGIDTVDGMLMDLGVSSYQFDEATRGFSYQHDGVLDMRMNPLGDGPSAYDLVMYASAEELERIFLQFGQERWGRRIAQFIITERQRAPIQTTGQLVEVIKKAIPSGARKEGPHPAKRAFQALRIAVNRELDILEEAIRDSVDCLNTGGRLAVISFHSLEDGIVKNTFRSLSQGCTCPKSFPVCVCGGQSKGKSLTPKPIVPGQVEREENPRCTSAKLRVFQKASAARE